LDDHHATMSTSATPSPSSSIALHSWLLLTLSSPLLSTHLLTLSALAQLPAPAEPEIKPYPDSVYLNYPTLGLSLLFAPIEGYSPPKSAESVEDLDGEKLRLEGVDLYNTPPPPAAEGDAHPAGSTSRPRSNATAYAAFPALPYLFTPRSTPPPRPPFLIHQHTTGADLVRALGEPARKGGGGGPKKGGMGIWLEWTAEGLMVELEQGEVSGPKEWDEGGTKRWKVMSLFERGKGGGAT
jgi:hypothetical protein